MLSVKTFSLILLASLASLVLYGPNESPTTHIFLILIFELERRRQVLTSEQFHQIQWVADIFRVIHYFCLEFICVTILVLIVFPTSFELGLSTAGAQNSL